MGRLKSHPGQGRAPEAVPGWRRAGVQRQSRAGGAAGTHTPGPPHDLAAGGPHRSLHVAPYLAAPGTDLPGSGGSSMAAAETSAATSLMHAPRPPWWRVPVRGPACPAAAPGVQRGGGGGETDGRTEGCLYPAAGTRPRRAARAAAILKTASQGSEAGSIATAGEEGPAETEALTRCAVAGRRAAVGRGLPQPAAPAEAGGGGACPSGRRWGRGCEAAAVPSREAAAAAAGGVFPRRPPAGRGRLCPGAGRRWKGGGSCRPAGRRLAPSPAATGLVAVTHRRSLRVPGGLKNCKFSHGLSSRE